MERLFQSRRAEDCRSRPKTAGQFRFSTLWQVASRDRTPNFSDATDIEPSDLVPDVSDYKIGPNDLVNVSIFDLLGEGTGEQVKTVRVTETGSVSLPFIPPVKADGLTERELETGSFQGLCRCPADSQRANSSHGLGGSGADFQHSRQCRVARRISNYPHRLSHARCAGDRPRRSFPRKFHMPT